MSANTRTKQMAAELHVTSETLLEWAKLGRVPCVRLSKKTVLFDRAKVFKALGIEDDAAQPAAGKASE